MADKITYENKAVGVEELSPIPKKVIAEPPESKKQPKPDSKGVVEIEVIKAHDGLEIGHTKRVQGNSATTIYMVENGYWKIK